MADDAHDERFHQHKAMLQGLARILAAQHEMNQQQAEFNRQQEAINERLEITQARIEALLARVFRESENGQAA
jgi:hypothetical protein